MFVFRKANKARDDFTETLQKKLVLAKKNMEWRRQHMTWEQTIKEYAKDAFEEGMKKGLEDGVKETAISLLNKTNLQPEMIADCCALSME